MKNRDYKAFAQGGYYHVFNRGNGKMDIFRDDQDYLNFLKRLRIVLGKSRGAPSRDADRLRPLPSGAFSLVSYCLMPNHYHFVVAQMSDIPVSKLILKVCTSYSAYFNKKYGHVGHLFQDQFKAVRIEDDEQLRWLSAYVHNNPKVAGLVRTLDEWSYSSYPDYACARAGDLCDKESVLQQFKSVAEYEKFIAEAYDTIKERKEVERLMFD